MLRIREGTFRPGATVPERPQDLGAPACTLPGAAISPPPVSQGRVQPGEVIDAAEIVEDKPSGARPGPEPMQPFELDPASLWGPRLSLYRDRRMWLPNRGPRPDQDGCQAPDYLL
jgi:hypothetical protein